MDKEKTIKSGKVLEAMETSKKLLKENKEKQNKKNKVNMDNLIDELAKRKIDNGPIEIEENA